MPAPDPVPGAAGATVAIRLLGPVDVVAGGAAGAADRQVTGRPARTVLAALSVRAGEVVSTDALIEAVWGADPPRTARHALHVHVSTLRKLLPAGLEILGQPSGYVLRVGPDGIDADRFEQLVSRGRAELASGRAAPAADAAGRPRAVAGPAARGRRL